MATYFDSFALLDLGIDLYLKKKIIAIKGNKGISLDYLPKFYIQWYSLDYQCIVARMQQQVKLNP